MIRSWPEIWRKPGIWTPLLWLLSRFYALAWLGRKTWQNRTAPVAVDGLRIVSVGNLSSGGTGKSAMVRAVTEIGLRKKWKTAVLLRGYGAQASERPLWVSKGKGPLVPVGLSGDEAREHALRPGLGVLIDPNRVRGAREARAAGYRFLVLDDGFQRRMSLARELDLVMTTAEEIALGEHLLPWGPWREPWSQAAAADEIFIQGSSAAAKLPRPWVGAKVTSVEYRPVRLWSWKAGRLGRGPSLKSLRRPVRALSGLGQPLGFERSLGKLGAKVEPVRFPDHHSFGVAELTGLDGTASSPWVTTMKDAMRLPVEWSPSAPVWVLEAVLEGRVKGALRRLLESRLK